jgi:hypothetical protein
LLISDFYALHYRRVTIGGCLFSSAGNSLHSFAIGSIVTQDRVDGSAERSDPNPDAWWGQGMTTRKRPAKGSNRGKAARKGKPAAKIPTTPIRKPKGRQGRKVIDRGQYKDLVTTTTRLDQRTREILEGIGQGNISAGVRIIVRHYGLALMNTTLKDRLSTADSPQGKP